MLVLFGLVVFSTYVYLLFRLLGVWCSLLILDFWLFLRACGLLICDCVICAFVCFRVGLLVLVVCFVLGFVWFACFWFILFAFGVVFGF